MKAVTLLSGGLDSTTLAYYMRAHYADELIAVSFNYGQRHVKELDVAVRIAQTLSAEHHIVEIGVGQALDDDLAPLGSIFTSSVLTNESVPVPDGHYAHENMKQTIVPNRNAIMLSIAYGIAVDRGAEYVSFAAHSGDHAIYPDCRPEFVALLNRALQVGNEWADPLPLILGPFLDRSKADIAAEAVKLGVPIKDTWSCYKGGDIHCGTCGTCYERREAFQLAGVEDPTEYLDSTTVFATPEGA
jgi:7-cyano-7-deazaguanine synthase